MNKLKYIIMNGEESALGVIYESSEYGKTIVLEGKLDLRFPVSLWNVQEGKIVGDMDFTKFIWEMLPIDYTVSKKDDIRKVLNEIKFDTSEKAKEIRLNLERELKEEL